MKSRVSFIIIYLFLYRPLTASQDLKILSSTSSSLIIEYTPEVIDTSEVAINGRVYKKFNLKNAVFEENESWGMPGIPYRVINIGVPSEFGNTIQIINSIFNTITGSIVPTQTPVQDKNSVSYQYILNENYNEYKSGDLVAFGEFGYVREIAVQSIKICPIQFDPASNNIKLYNKIVFKINFAQQHNNSLIEDKYIEDAVINYDIAKKWGKVNDSLKKRKEIVNSVLAQGTWYRFKAPEEGIYKITRSELESIGIDALTVDPRTIKIYNNGGYVLPEKQTAQAPTNLLENAIQVVGEEDGVFNEGDYILFYGRGVDFWEYGRNSDIWEHGETSNKIIRRKNWYTKNNFYWITSGGTKGKRIENKNSLNQSNVFMQTTTDAFAFVDDDKINVIQSGRVYLGDKFTPEKETYTYENSLDNIIPDSKIEYIINFANGVQTSDRLPLRIYEHDQIITSSNLAPANGLHDHVRMNKISSTYKTILPEDKSQLKINFDIRIGTSDEGYLDYLEIRYLKNLTASSDQLIFFPKDTSAVNEYAISNFSNSSIHVFDVSDFSSVKEIINTEVNDGQIKFQMQESIGLSGKYIALNENAFKKIENLEKVENSNIHGISQGAEYIIITDKKFKDEAAEIIGKDGCIDFYMPSEYSYGLFKYKIED